MSEFYIPPIARESIQPVSQFNDIFAKKVMTHTTNVLQKYFSNTFSMDISSQLRNETYPFMKQVALGALLMCNKNVHLSRRDTQQVLAFAEPMKTHALEDKAIEAFQFASVIIANMPEVIDRKYPGKDDVLKRNAVRPLPQTTVELLGRLREMQDVIREIYWGQVAINFGSQTKPAEGQERILRTLLFFEVGKDLPLNDKTEEKDIIRSVEERVREETIERDTVNRLLSGLNLDL